MAVQLYHVTSGLSASGLPPPLEESTRLPMINQTNSTCPMVVTLFSTAGHAQEEPAQWPQCRETPPDTFDYDNKYNTCSSRVDTYLVLS